jgi:hypothetical protein
LEAAGHRDDRNIISIAQQEEIARLDGRKKALDLAAGSNHGAANHIVRARWRGGGGDHDSGWFGV